MAQFYDLLFGALRKSSIGHGQAALLTPEAGTDADTTHRHFVLIQWQGGNEAFDLAVSNLSGSRSQCRARLRVPHLAEHDWRLVDLLGSETHERSGLELNERGLYLDVPPYAAQLFHFTPAR